MQICLIREHLYWEFHRRRLLLTKQMPDKVFSPNKPPRHREVTTAVVQGFKSHLKLVAEFDSIIHVILVLQAWKGGEWGWGWGGSWRFASRFQKVTEDRQWCQGWNPCKQMWRGHFIKKTRWRSLSYSGDSRMLEMPEPWGIHWGKL